MLADIAVVFLEHLRAMADQGAMIDEHAGYISQDIEAEMQPADLVEHHHVEWRRRRALLQITANMEAIMCLAAMQQIMNNAGIAVEREKRPVPSR
jgi:hypothetical protein